MGGQLAPLAGAAPLPLWEGTAWCKGGCHTHPLNPETCLVGPQLLCKPKPSRQERAVRQRFGPRGIRSAPPAHPGALDLGKV